MDKVNRKYVAFDWDGTLHNTLKLYSESVRRAYDFLVSGGYAREREFTEEQLSKYLGMTAQDMWADFMPDLEPAVQKEAERIVGSSMVELVLSGAAVLYDGVEQMLDELKQAGFELMILSNCKIAYLDAHRKLFGLDKWFTAYYPAEEYDFIPKEDILKLAMQEYPGEYAMIGDRYLDIYAGNVCGAYTVGCRYGFGSLEELAEADFVAKNIKDVCQSIKDRMV